MEKQETTEKCTVGTPVGNLVLEPVPENIVSINPPKITEICIQIGDDYATYKDCASLQEFLDNVKEYALLRKALDVARDMYLKKCEELGIWACPSEDDHDAIERHKVAFRNVGRREFDKAISEIMKRGK